jgi:NADPH-dependent ferric siderophore reductase
MSTAESSARREPGGIAKALLRMFMKHAQVLRSEAVAEDLRLITLESAQFKSVPWTAGQKVQIAMGSAFVARTFTPIEWDPATGRTRIVGYAHGTGPASEWIRSVKEGDECDVFGPRPSLDTSKAISPVVVFGDETSIGLAHAIRQQNLTRPTHSLFEVNALPAASTILSRLELRDAVLFERQSDDAHLQEIEGRLMALAAGGATIVLTGKASSIQRLRRALRNQDVSSARLLTKPYWAPGKTGLD